MDTPLVSVVLTVYNKPQFLRQCIDSVLNQTYTNFELIIMEDNSPNVEVIKIIDSYDDPRIIRCYSNVSEEDRYKTARYATLINKAVFDLAKGELITYLVDDDFYMPDRLEVLVNYMTANPDVTVVYHPLLNVNTEGIGDQVRGVKGILDGLTDDTQAFNYVDHNMVMHTKQAFLDADGWYDVRGVWGGADAYFWRRLNEAHHYFYPVGTNDHPLAAKRFHKDNIQSAIAENRFFPEDKI